VAWNCRTASRIHIAPPRMVTAFPNEPTTVSVQMPDELATLHTRMDSSS
jgi:hypothetical protein